MSQAQRFNDAATLAFVKTFSVKTPTARIVAAAKEAGIKTSHDKVNKAMGRFSIVYVGKTTNISAHKASLLAEVRKVVPLLYSDAWLLTQIGEAYSVKTAFARVSAAIPVGVTA